MGAVPLCDGAALRDDALLALIIQGDEQALGTLYDRYGCLVYSLALHCTSDAVQADTVTQNVFQQVWQQAGAFWGANGTLAEWIIELTRQRALAEVQARLGGEHACALPTEAAMAPAVRDECAVEAQAVLGSAVDGALRMLPLAQRQAIELAYYGGLTCTDIASLLAIPVSRVKLRLRCGLEQLKATLLPR